MDTQSKAEFERICNENWDSLLKVFKEILGSEDNSEKKIDKFKELKDLAKETDLLPRQIEGIIDRCDYRIDLLSGNITVPFSNAERMA